MGVPTANRRSAGRQTRHPVYATLCPFSHRARPPLSIASMVTDEGFEPLKLARLIYRLTCGDPMTGETTFWDWSPPTWIASALTLTRAESVR